MVGDRKCVILIVKKEAEFGRIWENNFALKNVFMNRTTKDENAARAYIRE